MRTLCTLPCQPFLNAVLSLSKANADNVIALTVYGRENRLKVKRDEEQAAAEQAEKDAVHQKASL